MLHNESGDYVGEYGAQIDKALAFLSGAQDESTLDAHVRWLFEEMLAHLQSADFTTREILATVALWAPVHSRVLRSLDVGKLPSAPILSLFRS